MIRIARVACSGRRTALGGILYVAIVLSLWAIAFWDISAIIDDYVNDSRYTLIRTVEIKGTDAPFLENAEVCVDYDRNTTTLLDQIWWNDSEVKRAQRETNLGNWDAIVRELSNVSILSGELSKRQLVYATKVIEEAYEMDNCYSGDITAQLCGTSAPFSRLFSRLPVQRLRDALYRQLSAYIWNGSSFLTPSLFTSQQACSYVQIRNVTTLPGEVLNTLAFGILYRGDQSQPTGGDNAFWRTQIDYVKIRFRQKYYKVGLIGYGHSVGIHILIGNVGLYDRSEVSPDCSGGRRVPQLGDNCTRDLYIAAMGKFCNCTPFSFIRTRPTRSRAAQDLPFCTELSYGSRCMERVRDYVVGVSCPERCRTTKNDYDVVWKFNEGALSPVGNGYSRARVSFILMDDAYSLYEEKFKMSFAQLVAQVGGDIGLYTGFSVLAMWQFILFIYSHYRKRRIVARDSSGYSRFRRSSSHATESWLGIVLCYLDYRCGVCTDEERNFKRVVESELRRLETKVSRMMDQLNTGRAHASAPGTDDGTRSAVSLLRSGLCERH